MQGEVWRRRVLRRRRGMALRVYGEDAYETLNCGRHDAVVLDVRLASLKERI